MADKATANISASVMSDFAKKTMGGTLSYEPANTGDQWIYLETIVDAASVALIADGRQYAERYIRADEGTETVTATGDIVRVLGYCIHESNDIIYFNPSSGWVEHS